MKRDKSIVISTAGIALVVIGLFVWQTVNANAAASTRELQTAVLQRGTLTATVTGAGAVVDLSKLEIQADVAELDDPQIKVGDTADATFDALPGKTYTATVSALGPTGSIAEGVVNYPVVLKPFADQAVKPGMTANVNIAVDQAKDVLFIPARTVHTRGKQKVVTMLVDGVPTDKLITTGLSNETDIQVTSGLKQGDVVVVAQTQSVGPGNQSGVPRVILP